MYVSGDPAIYASYIHQLPTTVQDVDDFIIDGNSYLNQTTSHLSGKWERELRRQKYLITNDLSYLDIQQLGFNYVSTLLFITDVNNSGITDVNNNVFEGWF